jgi:hypothetical protein
MAEDFKGKWNARSIACLLFCLHFSFLSFFLTSALSPASLRDDTSEGCGSGYPGAK